MTKRWSGILGWGSFVLACAASTAGVMLSRASDPYRPVEVRGSLVDLFWVAALLSLPAVGALILARRPANRIGWILCGMGVAFGIGLFSTEYGTYAEVVEGAALPARSLVAWFSISFRFVFFLPVLFLLLFPDGRPASRFWLWVVRVALGVLALGLIGDAFLPGRIESAGGVSNPIGIEGLEGPLSALLWIADTAIGFLFLLAAWAPFARFRTAAGEQRQQLKWVAYATLLFILWALVSVVLESRYEGASEPIGILGFPLIAGAVGISILKHRLYDIDLIVNRTLVYVSLSALLLGIYFASVFGLQLLTAPITRESDLAVAASTLVAAALFRPARRRVQTFIDRRFYRKKYDSGKAVDTFAARLRDEIELEVVHSDLLSVVRDTVQPLHAAIWLPDEKVAP